MLARGLDASFNPPNFTEAFAEGYRFIVRYLCPTPNRKVIDPDEVKRIHAAKLGLVLDWENDSGDSLRGRNGGLADGRQALALARDWIKYPKGSVIFFSVGDFDALPNQFLPLPRTWTACARPSAGTTRSAATAGPDCCSISTPATRTHTSGRRALQPAGSRTALGCRT